MIPTIYNFTQALLNPVRSFATLHDALPLLDASGMPCIDRTTRFSESPILWKGNQWLLCMPLTSAAIPDVERMAAHLKTLRSEWLADYRLLRGEMQYTDSVGTAHSSDLILQHLPAGSTFTEALKLEQPGTLLAALDALSEELTRLGLSHRNLKSENLRWCDGRLIPIRYHYIRADRGGDTEAFELLRHTILGTAAPQQTMHDVQATYTSSCNQLTGHRWTSHVFEQLVCVEDETGYGYVDPINRTVIPSQFIWADDFHEGRAAVETACGMGLIDKQGGFIIPAQYEIVEYDPASGHSQVRSNGLWADFDYMGRQMEDFHK